MTFSPNVSGQKNPALDAVGCMSQLVPVMDYLGNSSAGKVRVIELAEKQMKRWKKMRDKASDTESINFANQNIDRIMMDAVDELDRLE